MKKTLTSEDFYFYAFVRQDISVEQQMVQHGHACAKAGKTFYNTPIDECNEVLIGVPNKAALYDIEEMLAFNEIPFVGFIESYQETGLTAVCTIPLSEKKHRAVMAKFDLLKAVNTTYLTPAA